MEKRDIDFLETVNKIAENEDIDDCIHLEMINHTVESELEYLDNLYINMKDD